MKYILSTTFPGFLVLLVVLPLIAMLGFLLTGDWQPFVVGAIGGLLGSLVVSIFTAIIKTNQVRRLASARNVPFEDMAYVLIGLGWDEDRILTDPAFHYNLNRVMQSRR